MLVSPATRLPLARVLLLPLDITTSHLLPFAGYTSRIDPSFAADSPSVPTGKRPLLHQASQGIWLHRIGEHTSGMCIVDRCSHCAAYAPGTNYACVQAELKSRVATGPAEDELSQLCEDEHEGVSVVEGTPGAEAHLRIMMKRV